MARAVNQRNKKHVPVQKGQWLPGRKTRLALIAGLAIGLVFGAIHKIADAGTFPIRTVRVDGRFQNLQPEQIEALVEGRVSGGFFTVDVDAVREMVLAEPWVRHAAVQRSWPDSVRISVFEQEPVARWGAQSLLNSHGQVFTPALLGEAAGLPRLYGPKGTELRALQGWNEFVEVLRPLGIAIQAVHLNERRAWELVLNNGLHLTIGHTQELNRLARFVRSYAEVFAGHEAEVENVDLRYTNGFSVKWRESGDI